MAAGRLPDLLEASAARYPNRAAVVDCDARSLSFAELNARSDALAGFLSSSGVQPGDRVGLALPKSLEAVVSVFAIMKAGAAYVPIDTFSSVERGQAILKDCDVRGLIVNAESLRFMPPTHSCPALVVVDASATAAPGVPFDRATGGEWTRCPIVPTSLDLAYIIFTSGSSGVPKGAMITHANAISFLEWASNAFTPSASDRFSNHAPLHFDYSVLDLYLSLKHGASVYLVSEILARRPRDLARFIADNRLTVWSSTPSALMLLLQFGELDRCDASALRLVTFGGEVFPPKHLRALQQHWHSPEYVNLYGPTEITTACTYARVPSKVPADREAPYPIGFPCSHCGTLVLDEKGNEVSEDGEGLLYISGPSVFAGYWNRPAETSAVFLDRGGVRWYNTGDVVRWDRAEGFTYVGRRDRMVKRRGFRIELAEIERALHLHPAVLDAAAVSIPDANLGVRIVACVACSDNPPSLVELKSFCATKIPAYMVPDRFVFEGRLPRTSSDKVDYQTLKARMLALC